MSQLLADDVGEGSPSVAARVAAAREIAQARGVPTNAVIPSSRLRELAPMDAASRRVVEHRLRAGTLSARGLHRVTRVARTLADLEGDTGPIQEHHMCGALELRLEPEALEAA